ncbi:hypothetical protein KOI35_03725 [Actinoplanes bogorensis]|uniref:Uncharacterized protein n=1 Tax=Paractinoplanes bogorensis TaxID=1610840 RepID=A0ABS5YGL9_9ACTN|nr:hypothetical protein [Actinoplanes bogorensis]MBU2662607.1 hypothetical protein [Actinoplanes bogorensis]
MTPLDRTLHSSLIVAPVIYLVADVLYTLRGWDDPTAAVFHILGAAAYILVVFRLAGLDSGWLSAALLVVGALGAAGNVGYGFNTIHVSLGDTDLVDATGAATLIKPLGLLFPLTLLLAAVVVRRVGPGGVAPALGVAALAWPVAHIANIGWLAVLVNVVLVVAFAVVRRSLAHVAAPPRPATAASL